MGGLGVLFAFSSILTLSRERLLDQNRRRGGKGTIEGENHSGYHNAAKSAIGLKLVQAEEQLALMRMEYLQQRGEPRKKKAGTKKGPTRSVGLPGGDKAGRH